MDISIYYLYNDKRIISMSITYHLLTISVHKFSALNLNFPHNPSHLLLISLIDPSSSSFQSQIPIKSD